MSPPAFVLADLPTKSLHSGGQTGVDRGALDAARELGLRWGGIAPKNWTSLDDEGVIPEEYRSKGEIPPDNGLTECRDGGYLARTYQNVQLTGATLIIVKRSIASDSGTEKTKEFAAREGRPCWVVRLDEDDDHVAIVRGWLRQNGTRVLNVAGPSHRNWPEAQQRAKEFLIQVFRMTRQQAMRAAFEKIYGKDA